MVPDFAHDSFTAEIPLPNQGFPARFLGRTSQRWIFLRHALSTLRESLHLHDRNRVRKPRLPVVPLPKLNTRLRLDTA